MGFLNVEITSKGLEVTFKALLLCDFLHTFAQVGLGTSFHEPILFGQHLKLSNRVHLFSPSTRISTMTTILAWTKYYSPVMAILDVS